MAKKAWNVAPTQRPAIDAGVARLGFVCDSLARLCAAGQATRPPVDHLADFSTDVALLITTLLDAASKAADKCGRVFPRLIGILRYVL